MNFKEFFTNRDARLVYAGLAIGLLLGNALSGSKLAGRLSACQEMTSVLNGAMPFQLNCEVAKGDVWLSSPQAPGLLVSLDGKRTL